MYSSPGEVKKLIEQVLSWDIRSSSQRHRPHKTLLTAGNIEEVDVSPYAEYCEGEEAFDLVTKNCDPSLVVYHLILEGLDISYIMDCKGDVVVDSVSPVSSLPGGNRSRCNYTIWKDKLA